MVTSSELTIAKALLILGGLVTISTCFVFEDGLNCKKRPNCCNKLGLPTKPYVRLNDGRSKFSGIRFALDPASAVLFALRIAAPASGVPSFFLSRSAQVDILVPSDASNDCGLCLFSTLFGTPLASSTTASSGLDCDGESVSASSPTLLPDCAFPSLSFDWSLDQNAQPYDFPVSAGCGGGLGVAMRSALVSSVLLPKDFDEVEPPAVLVAPPVALAAEVVDVCVVALPHRLSHDRGGASSCVFGDAGLGSEFLRCFVGSVGEPVGGSNIVLCGRSLAPSLVPSCSEPGFVTVWLGSLACSALENQFNQLAESLIVLASSNGLSFGFESVSSVAGNLSSERVISGFSSCEAILGSINGFPSCAVPSPSFDARLSFVAPFVGLVVSDEMLSFVVVAASGKDLLELPIVRDRYTAGALSGVEES